MIAALLALSLLDFSAGQWKFMPEMRAEDAYKWLFHATLGGEHAVLDEDGPRKWLDQEWASLGPPLPGEPEVVRLDPEGRLIRVNLRPFKRRGGDKEMLLAIFVASAQSFHADKSKFVREWKSLGSRLRVHPIGRIRFEDWKHLDQETARAGYPAIDHSAMYEKAYSPAYRVILGSLWANGE